MENKKEEKRTVFSTKQVIIAACIIGFFIALAMPSSPSSDYDTDKTETESSGLSKEEMKSLEKDLNKLSDEGADPQSEKEELTQDAHIVKQAEAETDPMEELNNMIGLESVKEEVQSLINYVKLMKEREQNGLKSPDVTYHCVFSGNPGTGKTTVARLLARIYKNLGVVSKGQLIETDRSGLIGQYTGHTAPKTNAIIDQALGGVLFIDEAYALNEGENDAYGQEAVATLLKRMEDDRDDLVVIVAGYTEEMKKFIETNPGLKSRFTRYIDFPDYTPDELYRIFEQRTKPYSIILSADAEKRLRDALTDVVKHKDKTFGNGRYVRNLFETAVTNMANRLSKDKKSHTKLELSIMTVEDINYALKMVKV